jgi:hypothetical protein
MITRNALSAAALAAALLGCAVPLTAQSTASYCRAPDEHAEALRSYAADLANPTTDKLRRTADAYGILPAAAETVVIVADENLCRRAARRYAQELDEHGKLERSVHLIRIGEERGDVRYIAYDPDHAMGEYHIAMVLDRNLKLLASFTL